MQRYESKPMIKFALGIRDTLNVKCVDPKCEKF